MASTIVVTMPKLNGRANSCKPVKNDVADFNSRLRNFLGPLGRISIPFGHEVCEKPDGTFEFKKSSPYKRGPFSKIKIAEEGIIEKDCCYTCPIGKGGA